MTSPATGRIVLAQASDGTPTKDAWIAGATYEIYDAFSSDGSPPSGWTNRRSGGVWTVASGTVKATTAQGLMVNNTALSSGVTQWVKFQLVTMNTGTATGPGPLFRNGGADGTGYALQLRNGNDSACFRIGANGDAAESVGSSNANPTSIASGDWIGAEITGTGASTNIDLWKWASDPGARSNWGARYTYFTISSVAYIDSGSYVGLRSEVNTAEFDNYTADVD